MSSPSELISVVIPCYNAERYISDAIESALGQTYAHLEIIVVDDGSTDASLDIVKSFGNRIRWETGPNRGACSARNRGLELARGNLVQFLDADDLLDPRKLAAQAEPLLQHSADVVYCDWIETNLSGTLPEARMSATWLADPVVFALTKIVKTSTMLFHRAKLDMIGGFRKELACAQEYDLNLRLACAGATFHHCAEVLVTVRRVPGSVSSNSVRVLDEWEGIYRLAFAELRERGMLTDERAATFAARMAHDGRAYLRHDEVEKANARFRDAFSMHPSGGLSGAYGRATLLLRKALGPALTERIVQLKRKTVAQ